MKRNHKQNEIRYDIEIIIINQNQLVTYFVNQDFFDSKILKMTIDTKLLSTENINTQV